MMRKRSSLNAAAVLSCDEALDGINWAPSWHSMDRVSTAVQLLVLFGRVAHFIHRTVALCNGVNRSCIGVPRRVKFEQCKSTPQIASARQCSCSLSDCQFAAIVNF
jgi:hypothetical protein